MATLAWSEALVLHVPAMDDTHREFVDMLTEVETAPDEQLPALWQALIAHTEAHFGQEDRWMLATGFAPGNCHSTQHEVVLQVMREAANKAQHNDLSMIRGMTPELAAWFNHHAQTMDAALAQHMQAVGFDVDTGQVQSPDAMPQTAISGCGGACSTPEDKVEVGAASV